MSCCGSHVPAWPSLEAALGKPYLSHKAGRGPLAQWRLSGVLPLRQESFNHTQDSGLLVGTSLYWQLPSQSRPTVDLLPLLCSILNCQSSYKAGSYLTVQGLEGLSEPGGPLSHFDRELLVPQLMGWSRDWVFRIYLFPGSWAWAPLPSFSTVGSGE